jgi:hypothetical protein
MGLICKVNAGLKSKSGFNLSVEGLAGEAIKEREDNQGCGE